MQLSTVTCILIYMWLHIVVSFVVGVMPGGRQEDPRRPMNGEIHASVYDDLRSEDRYLQVQCTLTRQSSLF